MGTTPFHLLYGKSFHLPVELELKAAWAAKLLNFDIKPAAEWRLIQLNELDEIKHLALLESKSVTTESMSKSPQKYRISVKTSKAEKTNSRNGSPRELDHDTSQLARRARPCCRLTHRRTRPRHEPARPASTTVLPVDSPARSAATRTSSPGEHDRVAGGLAGELGRDTSQLARRAQPILCGPFRTRSHPITMHLRPEFL